MFDNKVVLITGGTGSFGQAFAKSILSKFKPSKVIIFSRDEMKQWKMAQHFVGSEQIRFFIGDVRDRDRLYRAFDGVDYVIHAAATKIVPTSEYNPFECVKTNVNGAMNVIDAALDRGVKKVVALSTDKASSPTNLYGGTKLVSDRLLIAGNHYSAYLKTSFSVVRYGNVMGSRGSVLPFFMSLKNKSSIPITDPRMTRFMITLDEAVKLVFHAFEDMVGGEIYVKKIPSAKITDIAKAVAPEAVFDFIGIRPGEKLHEQMISRDDASFTYEFDDYFKVLPQINDWASSPKRIKGGKKVNQNFEYSSDQNSAWMSSEDIRLWIEDNKDALLDV